tara:strand:+ start:1417 stop:1812 length:396 start_codon:yes stop_codon:yes gene_type:complete
MCLNSTAQAEGKFTFLGKGHCAPFEGTLFDPDATAYIVVQQDRIQLQCDLELDYQLDKLAAQHLFAMDSYKIRYESLSKKHELLEQSSETQIAILEAALKKKSPKNRGWWFVGGIAAGIGTTYSAYRMFNE